MLNTNALEYDYSEPIPDFTFMENELTNRKDEFEKSVVSMHAPPFADVFNDKVGKVFEHYILQYRAYSSVLLPMTMVLETKFFLMMGCITS